MPPTQSRRSSRRLARLPHRRSSLPQSFDILWRRPGRDRGGEHDRRDRHGLAVARVIGSGVFAATVWNVLMWPLMLPSSSGRALVAGLAGAALALSGFTRFAGEVSRALKGCTAWPRGLATDRACLAAEAVLVNRRLLRRATSRLRGPIRAFATPLEPEDMFQPSPGIDDLLNAPRTRSARRRWSARSPTPGSPIWLASLPRG
jgi:hypothetical protein